MLARILSAFACAILMAMPAGAQLGNIRNVFVIVMENHNWSQFKGAANALYINNTVLPQASHAEQYFNPPGEKNPKAERSEGRKQDWAARSRSVHGRRDWQPPLTGVQ